MDPFSLPTLQQCNELVDTSDCFFKKTEVVDGVPVTSFTYRLASYGDFNRPYARNLRGITFREDTQQLVAAPFWKFFNYGENPFTETKLVDTWKPSKVYNKLDGSLVYFYQLDGKLQAKTKFHCTSTQALKALNYVYGKQWMHDTILDFVSNGYTPMFEYVAPDNQIVLKYQTEDLVYLGMRDMTNGTLIPELPREMRNFTQPETYSYSVDTVLDFCQHTNELTEGFVIRFENDELVKFKTRKYLDIFHTLNSIQSSDKYIASLTLNGQVDDLIQMLPDHMKLDVLAKSEVIRAAYLETLHKGACYYGAHKTLNQKEFALQAMEELGRWSDMFSVAMGMYTENFNEAKFKEGYISKQKWCQVK